MRNGGVNGMANGAERGRFRQIIGATGLNLAGELEPLQAGEQFQAAGTGWTALCSAGGASPPLLARLGPFMAIEQLPDRPSPWAGFLSQAIPVEAGEVLRVTVKCLPFGAASLLDPLLLATLTWLDDRERVIARDVLDWSQPVTEDGVTWQVLGRLVEVPESVRSVRLQLGLAAGQGGGVVWDARVGWERCERGKSGGAPPTVTIAAVRINVAPNPSLEGNLRLMQEAIAKASATRSATGRLPQLVCLSENFLDRGVRLPLPERSESLEEPSAGIAGLCRSAKEHRLWVCTSVHERKRDGRLYNTALLIDPNGRIAGTYHKTHLTVGEIEMGLVPGDEFPVFETELGRIGMLVCWDLWFPEPARVLALKGADIILVPLAGDGSIPHRDHTWPTRAMDNNVVLVVAGTTSNTPSRIISADGEVLAETYENMGVAVADVHFDRRVGLHWLSVGPSFGETALYFQQRRPELYESLTRPLKDVARPGQESPRRLPDGYLAGRFRSGA